MYTVPLRGQLQLLQASQTNSLWQLAERKSHMRILPYITIGDSVANFPIFQFSGFPDISGIRGARVMSSGRICPYEFFQILPFIRIAFFFFCFFSLSLFFYFCLLPHVPLSYPPLGGNNFYPKVRTIFCMFSAHMYHSGDFHLLRWGHVFFF